MEPNIGRFPIEVFGYAYNDHSPEAQDARDKQYCPFLKRECTKPRKSLPHIKVGVCSIGYKGKFMTELKPVIVCPSRFLEEIVFQSIHDRFFPEWESYKWVKEVNMGVSGNVDYVAVRTSEVGGQPTDFYCVEIQAAGTTNGPYPYVEELLTYDAYRGKYAFGINWANEFLKTMMQQVYKKGQVVASWNKKIVFVIQDVALEYLKNAVDTSDLRHDTNDVVHFVTYRLEWDKDADRYTLLPGEWVSTDLDGINKILAGANPDKYLTWQAFLEKTVRKGQKDGVL